MFLFCVFLFFPSFFSITQNVHENFVSTPCFFEMPTLSSMSFQKRSSFYYTTHLHPPSTGKVLGSWRCLQGIGAIVAPSWGGAPVDGEFRSPNPKRLKVRVHGILDHLFEIMMILIFKTCKNYNINCMKCFTERKSWDIFFIIRTGDRWISSINNRMEGFCGWFGWKIGNTSLKLWILT